MRGEHMPLYRVTVTQDVFMCAANARAAERAAPSALRDDMGDPLTYSTEVKEEGQVDRSMLDSLVHGAERDTTIRECIAAMGAK